jgi:hypothetical protein
MPLTLIAAVLLVVLASGADARRHSCRGAGAHVVKRAPEGRVYRFDQGPREGAWACAYRFGRSYKLDEPSDGLDTGRPFAFAGRFFAYWVAGCEAEGSQCTSALHAMNMANGRDRHFSLTSILPECEPNDCRDRVGRIVLKRNASVAWTATQPDAYGSRTQVLRIDHRGRKLLDSGKRIARRSLRLCGRRRHVCWRSAGRQRSATLD